MRYSGTQLSVLPQVEPYEINRLCSGGDQPLHIESSAAAANTKPRVRKHRPKGSASGWLETRTGNRKRKKPSVSYLYKWDSSKGRVSEYVKTSKVSGVSRMLTENRPALEILEYVIEGKKKPSKLAQTLLANSNSASIQMSL